MNWSEIETAKNRMNNPVWKEIYDSLLTCRRYLLESNPLEFLTLPVNGEPYLTKNITAIQQPWCENLTINDILDKNGNFKKPEEYLIGKRPVFYENSAIENALGEFIKQCQYLCGKTGVEWHRQIKPPISNMNAYGRIVHRKAKGCSNFYNLLSFHDKKDGWDGACCSME